MGTAGVGVECANGCLTRTKVPVRCSGSRRICDRCYERLEGWLAELPELLSALSELVPAGSLQGERSEGKAPKKAHAQLPIRVDVVALLDDRGDESVSLLLNRWAGWVAACRGLRSRPTWSLGLHLPWLASTDQVKAFYDQIRAIHQKAERAAGRMPPAAVGTCGAEIEGEACGGPLLPLAYSVGVECSWCGDTWQEGDLRGLGRVLSKRWVPVAVAAYVSARPEATVRDWIAGLELPAVCDLRTRQIQVDAVALAPLAQRKRTRRRRSA